MKLLTLALVTLSFSSLAAEVRHAKLDIAEKNLLVDVTYSGGCSIKHTFSLELQGCQETYPVRCFAKLIEKAQPGYDCEVISNKTIKFSLKKYGLDESYYAGGSLIIKGNTSSVSVGLP